MPGRRSKTKSKGKAKAKSKAKSKARPKAKPKAKSEPEPKPEEEIEEVVEAPKELSPEEKLQNLLEEQLHFEEGAVTMYNRLLLHFKNPAIQRDLTLIRDDEVEHTVIIKEIIGLIK